MKSLALNSATPARLFIPRRRRRLICDERESARQMTPQRFIRIHQSPIHPASPPPSGRTDGRTRTDLNRTTRRRRTDWTATAIIAESRLQTESVIPPSFSRSLSSRIANTLCSSVPFNATKDLFFILFAPSQEDFFPLASSARSKVGQTRWRFDNFSPPPPRNQWGQ